MPMATSHNQQKWCTAQKRNIVCFNNVTPVFTQQEQLHNFDRLHLVTIQKMKLAPNSPDQNAAVYAVDPSK